MRHELLTQMLTDIDADIANYSAMRDRLAAQLDSSSYTPDRFSGERKLALYDELILELRERRCDVERMMKE